MDIKNFEELQKVISKSIEWDEDSIEEMEKKLGKLYQNLTNLFFKEKLLTDNLHSELKKLYADIFKDLKENSNRALENKYEMETTINCNEEYYKLNLEFNKQKAILDWMEKTLDNLSSIKYEIKDFMNWKLFKSGMRF